MKPVKLILIFVLFSFNIHLLAQYEYPGAEKDDDTRQKKGKYANSKLFVGGNFSLWFGNVTYIDLNPVVGYKITPRLWSGIGPMYKYLKDYFYYGTTIHYYETNIYGAKVFGQFTVFKDLNEKIKINLGDVFLYAETDFLNHEPILFNQLTNTIIKENRKWIDISLVGFGMRYNFGQRLGISMFILWDITQNPEYSGENPQFRLGFNF